MRQIDLTQTIISRPLKYVIVIVGLFRLFAHYITIKQITPFQILSIHFSPITIRQAAYNESLPIFSLRSQSVTRGASPHLYYNSYMKLFLLLFISYRSHRGLFWTQCQKYLTELRECYTQGSLSEAEKFFTAVAHRVKVNSGRIQFIQYTSTLQKRLIFKIPGYIHTVENVDV